ncbi:ATP-binding protein [Kitasatospora sp. NPDC092948]|uniref:ATP-binding protein n=1 Tax=Kitasatospora sp. NPDC092948 TaxID=3364088 RepID=UPI00380823F9
MVARAVPVQAGSTTSAMAVPHGPASVSTARRRLRSDLGDRSIPDTVIDDAVLILSELLSNSCRHARPLPAEDPDPSDRPDGRRPHVDDDAEIGTVLVSWRMRGDGLLTLEVTDGGATTRPVPASPSLSAHGGRGLSIVGKLAKDWGVRHAPGQVTVWAELPAFEQVAGGEERRSA